MSLINSWNEWDPLQEVIVGSARGVFDIAYEPSLSCYFPPGSQARQFRGGTVPPVLVDEAQRQLDHLADLLACRGITVRRPDPAPECAVVQTPDWQALCGNATACPRDVLLVVGNQVIEAPMTQRARSREYLGYRSLMAQYETLGGTWTVAPKPRMADDLYREAWPARDLPFDSRTGALTEAEPVFDAACFARFGRDLFWQPDMVSNAAGADWLARHLGPDCRVHRIEFREKKPTHIDTTLVPIRPGLVLTNPQRPCTNGMMDLFHANGWQVVEAPPSVRTGRAPSRDVSNWISLNILMLDSQTAVVEQAEKPMMDLLRSLGCEVVPCAFDRVYAFGGGFHCCTADVRREGTLQSYFPSLDG